MKSKFICMKFEFTRKKSEFPCTKFEFTCMKSEFTYIKSEFICMKFAFTCAKSAFTCTKFEFICMESEFTSWRLSLPVSSLRLAAWSLSLPAWSLSSPASSLSLPAQVPLHKVLPAWNLHREMTAHQRQWQLAGCKVEKLEDKKEKQSVGEVVDYILLCHSSDFFMGFQDTVIKKRAFKWSCVIQH